MVGDLKSKEEELGYLSCVGSVCINGAATTNRRHSR